MKRLKLVFSLVLFVCLMLSVGCDSGSSSGGDDAASVTGTWDVTLKSFEDGKDITLIWILSQTGTKVEFVYGGELSACPSTMAVTNDVFTFSISFNNDEATVLAGTGTLSGDSITGTWNLSENMSSSKGILTLTRTSKSIDIPQFNVPSADITIDGTVSDWDSISTFIADSTGDSSGAVGTDIEYVKLSTNSDKSKVNVLVKIASGSLPNDSEINFSLDAGSVEKEINISYDNGGSAWIINGSSSEGDADTDIPGLGGVMIVSGQYIEFSFNLAPVVTLNTEYIGSVNIRNDDDAVDESDFFGQVVFK